MSKPLSKAICSAGHQCQAHTLRECTPLRRSIDDRCPLLTHRSLQQQSRPFTTTQPWLAGAREYQNARRAPAQPSMRRVQAKERARVLREEGIPETAVGLLPETFIMPRGRNRPGWFENFSGRKRLEVERLKIRFKELLIYWHVRPQPRLNRAEIPAVAKNLHKDMYQNFAGGDLSGMESRLCEGLLNSLRNRIAQRAPGTYMKWSVQEYLSKPRIVSYKPALIPGPAEETAEERNGVLQAIVRIHTRQTLQHVKLQNVRNEKTGQLERREVYMNGQGKEVEQDVRDSKESVEYVVVQKMLSMSKEGPWKLWGMAEEMTLDKLAKIDKDKKDAKAGQKRKDEAAAEVAGAS